MPSISIFWKGQRRQSSWNVWGTKANCPASQKVNPERYHLGCRTGNVIARLILGREPSPAPKRATPIPIATRFCENPRMPHGSCKRHGGRVRMDASSKNLLCREKPVAPADYCFLHDGS